MQATQHSKAFQSIDLFGKKTHEQQNNEHNKYKSILVVCVNNFWVIICVFRQIAS